MRHGVRLRKSLGAVLILFASIAGGCVIREPVAPQRAPETQPPVVMIDPIAGDANPTPSLANTTRERREVVFASDAIMLAGELDLPLAEGAAPLVFIIHHSGPVTRDAYGYMAELLTEAGFAVFRFDKRGTGRSRGEYGCCEADDAIAAYHAAVGQEGIDLSRVLIVAQSIGTEHLAERFSDFAAIQAPLGVVLLSSLLGSERIVEIAAPVHVIVSDSEGNLDSIGANAVAAHRQAWPDGAIYYIAEQSEHTLFDITDGPIDWSDPGWVKRYHRGAMQSMIDWMRNMSGAQKGTTP